MLSGGGKFSEEEWYCDIYSLMYERIKEYNDVSKYDTGADFKSTGPKKQKLKDLLRSDIEHLAKYNPHIEAIKDRIYVEEAIQDIPNAAVLTSNNNEFLILFNTPLLNLIHSFYAYFDIVTQTNKLTGCLEKYDEIALSEEFSDTSLMGKIMLEIKNFYSDRKLHSINNIEFIHEPYNLCERVKATRRFIIAHEIAHVLLNHHHQVLAKKQLIEGNNDFSYLFFRKKLEYDADALGVDLVLSQFAKDKLSEIEHFELINTINGIRLFFVMLEFVESFHEWYMISPEYPHSTLREMSLFNHVGDWMIKYRHQGLKYLEGFTVTKNLFRKLPFDAPAMQFSSLIFVILETTESMTDEEIISVTENLSDTSDLWLNRAIKGALQYHLIERNSSDRKVLSRFLIKYKGYFSVYKKYNIYNFVFTNMSDFEFQTYFMYYAVQFGPEYAKRKIEAQYSKQRIEESRKNSLLKLANSAESLTEQERRAEQASIAVSTGFGSFKTESEHDNELMMLSNKQHDVESFFKDFHQRFKQCFTDCLTRFNEEKNKC